jgi:hypothetical protein
VSMNMSGMNMGGTTTPTTTTTTSTSTSSTTVTTAQVEQYIESLDLSVGSANYDLFNRLLLLDSALFQELISKVVVGTITLDNIRALSRIDNPTVENYLYQLDNNNVPDAIAKRQYYIDTLNNQFNFQSMKTQALPSFATYIYSKYQGTANYFTSIVIDSLGLTTGSFNSFYTAEQKYLSIVGFRPLTTTEIANGDDFHLYDSVLETKYRDFLNYHNTFEFANPNIKSLIDLALTKGIFLQSDYNLYKFTNYPTILLIMKGLYKFIAPFTFDTLYNELLEQMIQMYGMDAYGWQTIKTQIGNYDWQDLANKFGQMDDISDYFYRIQLIRYFYPKMYGAYNVLTDASGNTVHDSSGNAVPFIDTNMESSMIQNFVTYFDKAAAVFLDIPPKIAAGMVTS